jgi:hypothetical protein
MEGKMKKVIYPIFFQFLLYLIQFIGVPLLTVIAPSDNARQLGIIISSTSIITFIGMFFFERRIRYWGLGYCLYLALVLSFRPFKVYGIDGSTFLSLNILRVLSLSFIVLIVEMSIFILVAIFKRILSK